MRDWEAGHDFWIFATRELHLPKASSSLQHPVGDKGETKPIPYEPKKISARLVDHVEKKSQTREEVAGQSAHDKFRQCLDWKPTKAIMDSQKLYGSNSATHSRISFARKEPESSPRVEKIEADDKSIHNKLEPAKLSANFLDFHIKRGRPTGSKTMKKKRRKGADLPKRTLPFILVNVPFNRNREEDFVLQAIFNLKRVDDTNFIDHYLRGNDGRFKIINIQENEIKEFYNLYHRESRLDYSEDNSSPGGRRRIPEFVVEQSIVRRAKYAKAVENFRGPTKIQELEDYKQHVSKQFSHFIHTIEKAVDRTPGEKKEQLINESNAILGLLPLYLFHVDMINTLIPSEKNKELVGSGLGAQRELAGKIFLEIARKIIAPGHQTIWADQNFRREDLSMFARHDFNTYTALCSFNWQVLGYWLKCTRSNQFHNDVTYANGLIHNQFKHFINDILASSMDKYD
jgi:hypothetical protein